MRINVHAGHTPSGFGGCGAIGILNESDETRKIKDIVIKGLSDLGHTVYDCTDDDGRDVNSNLYNIIKKCNANQVDLDVSIHLNAGRNDYDGDGSIGGTEVYVYPGTGADEAAERVVQNICELGFTRRGVKDGSGLYVIRNTVAPAMLIECCFVDDADDCALYDCEKMAKAIVMGIDGAKVENNPPVINIEPEECHIVYKVMTIAGWLPEVMDREDYAGLENNAVFGFMAKLTDGSALRYRVHTIDGRWLPWVSGYDEDDFDNGYAGNGVNKIDAIELKCDTHTIGYCSSRIGDYDYFDDVSSDTEIGPNSYCGAFGSLLDKVMCWIDE